MTPNETYEWIVKRYGKVTEGSMKVFIAAVPVMGGIAMGQGTTKEAAVESLYADLTNQEDRPTTAEGKT